jgi:hypothetical protein
MLPSSGDHVHPDRGVPSGWEYWRDDNRKFQVTLDCNAGSVETEVTNTGWTDGNNIRFYDANTCPTDDTPPAGSPGGAGSIPAAGFQWRCQIAPDYATLEHPGAPAPMAVFPGNPIQVRADNKPVALEST